MDVDKASHSFVFEDFVLSLQKCDFCAIDQEMTGVSCVENRQSGAMSLNDVYTLTKTAVNRYIAFQFGIALFTLLENGDYEVKPFNFYLMKESGDFTVNADAVKFLSEHNMNFQKWIKTGMPYHNKQEEVNLMAQKNPIYSEEENAVADDIVKKIERWFQESAEETTFLKKNITKATEKIISSRIDANHLCVFVEYSREKYYDLPTDIKIRRVSSEEHRVYITQKMNRERQCLQDALGFREFWKVLTQSKKPIIGHNFFTDLMFMINMHECPLPDEYEIFKQQAHELFPFIYDTKTLASALQDGNLFKRTSLSDLFRECCKINEKKCTPVVFRCPPGYHYYDAKCVKSLSKAHEAGYDAYMTGVVYAIMRVIINGLSSFDISKWRNVLSVYMSHYFMNLEGEDMLKDKGVFVVEFDLDIDDFLARSLLVSEEKIKRAQTNREESVVDFQIAMKNTRKRDREVLVQFEDERTTEDCVTSRINTSILRLKNSPDMDCQETGTILPKLRSVRRLL